MNDIDAALLNLGKELKSRSYRFTTITPETHGRINRRAQNSLANSVEAVLGWSRPFQPRGELGWLAEALQAANALEPAGNLVKSRVRFSSIGPDLFVHSAFPTTGPDSVFFGPDTYRFVRVLRYLASQLSPGRVATLVDLGTGSGAAGIVVAGLIRPARTILTDINVLALRYAAINARLNGADCITRRSDLLQDVPEPIDLIIANPPYIQDLAGRQYRHGGDTLGTDLSVRIVRESIARLQPGGCLLLYTGAPFQNGVDVLRAALEPYLDASRFSIEYAEVDPDVFGEELENAPYLDCERIAAVSLVLFVR